jgi:hypothetical protein
VTKPNSTLIAIVLDRSGSMQSIAADTIGGFNSFLEEQRKVPNDDARLTFVQFDHEYDVIHDSMPLKDVPALTSATYVPRGSTALLDAMGRTINTVGASLARMPESERPSQVVFCIITDGQENASREYTHARVSELIQHQQAKYRWNFVFLGANMDAISVGGGYGVSAGHALTFTSSPVGMVNMYASLSSNVASYRATADASCLNFTDDQRSLNADPNGGINLGGGAGSINLGGVTTTPGVSISGGSGISLDGTVTTGSILSGSFLGGASNTITLAGNTNADDVDAKQLTAEVFGTSAGGPLNPSDLVDMQNAAEAAKNITFTISSSSSDSAPVEG